ncbi:DUF2271 domain-containing protein [uncultured Parasphingorhabdus sp.]|uniref:DUF2271 domain-containing protein n=1 Tax=uncultured Parasphingorhabdus sp. TaxID=2709694 RepID=UPI0030D910D6|tara:strand:+ start:64304 stop:64834 length:531 start_codon:yes stop_codon:yes gene_type:complete
MTYIPPLKTLAFGGVALLVASPAMAEKMTVSYTIPRMTVAEYHRPYTAIWIEDAAGKAVATLNVSYDVDLKGEDGRKWLTDLRGWWRKAGRSTTMPAQGISGPTQAPGTHRVTLTNGRKPLGTLKAGAYKLRVEAAREVGGREMVTIPFSWSGKGSLNLSAKGKSELGAVSLSIKP